MTVLKAMSLDQQDRILLRGFDHPRGSALQWDTRGMDWAIGSFGMSPRLLARVDRLLDAGLIRFADVVDAHGYCDVLLTEAGREAIA